MKLALVWAMARNRVIGKDNQLPWRLPNDMKRFRQLTTGKCVIMGRKTYDSLGKPLPDRENIVITRQQHLSLPGVHVAGSLEEAIELAESLSEARQQDEIMVMGGAEIYARALPMADRLYITQVHADIEGDTCFPEFDMQSWQLQSTEEFCADADHSYDYSFAVYSR
ncbi:dihydrofolate reductase [Gynuella sunshinyii]|uniref:Dihydrofolate reductase n=1 Tax=Gynuella sunshinyii YC6258 TaxID=1445510 RepID=A0A0C5VU79_9GAMM|nr:dihydrofolate reductase [Gynuella sunshinyii]AJQ97716.1 dihydrofolate reductase [Gynuella sunshinyii YC6258]